MNRRISRCSGAVRALVTATLAVGALGAAGSVASAAPVVNISHKDSPADLDIGKVEVAGSVSSSQQVTLTNTGDADATSLVVTVTAGGSDFSIANLSGSTLTTSTPVTFDVVCDPSTSGDLTGTVSVSWMGGGSPPATFNVKCYGPPLWFVSVADPIDFGNREVGTSSPATSVQVRNDSSGSIDINTLAESGANCGNFSEASSTTPITLAAGAMTMIDITFSPSARGTRTCTLTLQDSDTGTTDNSIGLTGNGVAAVLSRTPASLAFGSHRVGTATNMTFTINNTSTDTTGCGVAADQPCTLDISSISLAGGVSSNYSLSASTATIAPGGSSVITVTFNPTSPAGAENDTVNIDANEPSMTAPIDTTVSLTGTATEALLTTSASTVNFGTVRINGGASNRTVDMQNPGAETVTVDGITLTTGDTTQFSIQSAVPPPNITIAGGNSSTVNLRCDPSTIGAKTTKLHITSDDDGPSPDEVTLNCTGGRSYVAVSNVMQIDFGDVLVGGSNSVTRSISNLNNANALPLNATFITASPFSTSIGGVTNLAAGSTTNFQVSFSPTATGTFNDTLTIMSDDPVTPSIVINLTGRGVKPIATLVLPASGALDFGNVQVGSTSGSQTVRVRNDGTSDLTISSVSRLAPNPAQFAHSPATPPNVVLAPGASADWAVTCSPTSVGTKSSTLRIVNDDASNGQIDVPLSCTGVQAALVVSPSPVNFNDVRVCENKEIDVTLQNQGTADLNVTGLTLSSARYTIVSGLTTPFTIGPSASTVQRVRFTPTAGGNADGTLTIQSDDPNSPTVVNLLANGVVAQMGINATTHDFGDVRIDQAFPNQTFTITNNGTADFQIMSLALSDTTNFSVQPISPATLPATLSPTQTATFRVTARPQSLGVKSATVTINTDIPAAPCGMATTVVSVDATGVVPDASFTPTTVAFGPQDVQASPATENITVMNTGTAPLEVSDLVISGTAAARYTVSSNALPFTIPVSSSAVVQVTYTPVTVSSADDASLRIVTDAQSGMNMDIPLSGRGIDREIVPSVTSLDFPDTYRNSDNPPQLQVKIDNAGEAPLAIQMVSKTGGGENAFTLVNQLDSTIAGLSNSTLTVQFDPGSGGDFAATLVIMNDDDQRPRVEIALNGRGVVPNFMPDRGDYDMTAGDCDLSSANPTGCIGVGIPTKLTAAIPDGIRFTNLEPQAFRVRELRLVDDDGAPVDQSLFRIVDFQSEDVGPNQVYTVDVEFTAPSPGDYHATLEVYLDNDPERVVFVTVRATAVEVRLRGGGCAAGGGAGLGAALLLLLAAGLLRRRRAAALVAGLGLLLAAAPARADRTRNLDLTTFRPMPGVEWQMLSVESPHVGEPGAWFLGLFLDHSVNPLNLESPQIQGMSDALVAQRTSMDLAFAYAFGGRFEAGALVPMMQQSGSDSTVVRGVDSAQGFSLGDVALHGKASIYDGSPLSLAAAATVTLPTSTSGEFAGVGGPTAHAQLIGGLDISRISIAANAGFRLRGSGEFGDLHQGNEITYAVATSYRVQRQVWAIGELFGAFGLSRQGSTQGVSPLEWTLGARYRMTREVSFGAGVGAGLMGGIGAPDFRGFALVAYTPNASPIGQLPTSGTAPVIDNGDDDGDGIVNSKDECPQQAEDKDGFQDEDGCPDPDNDKDGFPDGSDPCPMAAEDKDGFKDDDGCPDEDNDEDGIPDAQDKCPDVPEDKDGFQDRDGCDDPDNDSDGIPDVIDQCATEPETINGKDDDDGCPDEGESLVMVMPDRIEVFEPIRFVGHSDRISKKSHNVLGQVAATLRANRDFIRVRIAVHVQPRNSHDLELTQTRAKAVRQWLIQWGIEPERLETKGFGSTRPLVPKNKRGAAKVNDRVEFIILEKKIE